MLHLLGAAVLSLTMSQTSDNSYKEWLRESIQDGSIYYCTENDITVDLKHIIGFGAFGVVYKATVRPGNNFEIITKTTLGERHNGSVAVKILRSYEYGDCEEDSHRQFVKEVAHYFLLCYIHICVKINYWNKCHLLAKASQGSEQPP